jgi:anti-anti-sigma factor
VGVRDEGDFAIVSSHGYINNLGGEKLGEACHTLIDQGHRKLILNLRDSPVVNSIGISILIEIIEKVLGLNGRIAFTELTPTIEKTFKIMGLLQYAEHYPTESEAVARFRDGEAAGGGSSSDSAANGD